MLSACRWQPLAVCAGVLTGQLLTARTSCLQNSPVPPAAEYHSLDQMPPSAHSPLPVVVTHGSTHADRNSFSNHRVSGSIQMTQQTGRPEYAPRLWMRVAVTVQPECSETGWKPHDYDYFVSAEIDGSMQLSLFQRAITRLILQLSKYYWPSTHWSFGDERENAGLALPLVGLAQQYCKPGTDTKSVTAYQQLETGFEYVIEGKNGYLDLDVWKYKQPGMNRNYDLSYFWSSRKLRVPSLLVYKRVVPSLA